MMLAAHGLYGHIRNNNFKSLALFASFLASLVMLWIVVLTAWSIIAPWIGWFLRDRVLQNGLSYSYLSRNFFAVIGGTLWVPLLVGALWTGAAVYLHAAIIRSATGARGLSRREDPHLYNLVENLSIAAGIPMPSIEVMETSALNAYAMGVSPQRATVAVSRGLLDTLSDRELETVLAHEITHIKNYDTRLKVLSVVLQGMLSRVAEFSWTILTRHKIPLRDIFLTRDYQKQDAATGAIQRQRLLTFLAVHSAFFLPFVATWIPGGMLAGGCLIAGFIVYVVWRGDSKGRHSGQIFNWHEARGHLPALKLLFLGPTWLLAVVGGFLAALAYVMSAAATGAISRSREYMADAGAVDLTKAPDALISALKKVNSNDQLQAFDTSVQALMISSPQSGWLATHPSLDERVEALRAFGGGRVAANMISRQDRAAVATVRAETHARPSFGKRVAPTGFGKRTPA